MMAVEERTPLIDREPVRVNNMYPRNYVIFVVTCLNLCGMEMGSVAFDQYIVKYFKENADNSTTKLSTGDGGNISNTCDINSTGTQENSIQKESAHLMMYFELLEYGIGIPALLVMGFYIEIYGRKLCLLICILGNFIKYGIITSVVYFELSLKFIFIAYALGGLFCSTFGFFMCCATAIADITDTGKSRTFQIALLYYFNGIGLTVSQVAVGYIIALCGHAVPPLVSCGGSFLSCLLISFIMKETFVSDRSQAKSNSCCDVFSSYLFVCVNKDEEGKSNTAYYILALSSLLLMIMPAMARTRIDILYLLGSPFCFSSESIGWFEAAREFCMMNIGTLLLRVLLFCMRDEVLGIVGCISGILCYGGMALATNEWMLYAAIGSGILTVTPLPLIKSILSKMVGRNKQGIAFANMYAIEALCGVLGQTLFLNIYADTRPIYRGIVYFTFCVFNIGSILLLIPVMVYNRKQKKCQDKETKINAD